MPVTAACAKAVAGVLAVSALVLAAEPSVYTQQFTRSAAPEIIHGATLRYPIGCGRLPGHIRLSANAVNDRGILTRCRLSTYMLRPVIITKQVAGDLRPQKEKE